MSLAWYVPYISGESGHQPTGTASCKRDMVYLLWFMYFGLCTLVYVLWFMYFGLCTLVYVLWFMYFGYATHFILHIIHYFFSLKFQYRVSYFFLFFTSIHISFLYDVFHVPSIRCSMVHGSCLLFLATCFLFLILSSMFLNPCFLIPDPGTTYTLRPLDELQT